MNTKQKSAKEKNRLAKIAKIFSSKTGFNKTIVDLGYQTLKKYFYGKKCLELGSADGEGTRHLIKFFDEIYALDGSQKLINNLKKTIKSKKLKTINSLIEDYKPQIKFDTIIMAHILEHINNPVTILKLAKSWLKKDGVIIIEVPNAMSINRQLGVKMGLIKKITDLHKGDLLIGHRRIYSLKTLARDVKKAKLKIIKSGGILLKPFSNEQMEQFCNRAMIKGLYKLGEDYPEIAADIYLVCKK